LFSVLCFYDYTQVATPFEIGPNVKPIPLSNIPLQTGRIAIVSGWGVTTEDGTRTPNLQKVAIPVLPQWECKLVSRDKIIDGMFCAGRAGRSACYGDSGGPVVVDGYQIGIVSGGYSCELPGVPGFYVNVYELRNWIYENCGV
jgi:trypsin